LEQLQETNANCFQYTVCSNLVFGGQSISCSNRFTVSLAEGAEFFEIDHERKMFTKEELQMR
jgi:hypothetical protein